MTPDTLPLFDDAEGDGLKPWQRPDPVTLARTSDPDTSHAAARALGGKAGTMRRALLEAFAIRGELTAEEAAAAMDLDPWQASKRVSDLANAGFVEDTGERRTGTHGRPQRVLRITPAGSAALRAPE